MIFSYHKPHRFLHQHGRHKFLARGIRLQGTVRNAYYGASLTYAGDGADLDLACENVRRGCMSYGLRNATVRMRMKHARGQPASNGFICLACEGASAGNPAAQIQAFDYARTGDEHQRVTLPTNL